MKGALVLRNPTIKSDIKNALTQIKTNVKNIEAFEVKFFFLLRFH